MHPACGRFAEQSIGAVPDPLQPRMPADRHAPVHSDALAEQVDPRPALVPLPRPRLEHQYQ
jgi:hypothetical protein